MEIGVSTPDDVTEHVMELISTAESPPLGSEARQGLATAIITHPAGMGPDDFGTITRRDAAPGRAVLPASSKMSYVPDVSGDDEWFWIWNPTNMRHDSK